jgi:hypothetical protein
LNKDLKQAKDCVEGSGACGRRALREGADDAKALMLCSEGLC